MKAISQHDLRQRRGNRRKKAAVTILLGMAAGASVTTSPAHAASQYRFEPQRLECFTLNDGWPDNTDEISLRYGPVDFRVNMKRGERVQPPPIAFGSDMIVNLWELDTGTWRNPHDFLGNGTVIAQGSNGDRELVFTNDGASYRLVYRVLEIS